MKNIKEDKFNTINVEESVGRVLMHDITRIVPGIKCPHCKKTTKATTEIDRKKLFDLAVVSVDNLTMETIEEDKKGEKKVVKTKVVTSEQFLEQPGLENFYYDVVHYIIMMNAQVDAKN